MNAEDKELLREFLKQERDGKIILVEPPDVAVRLLEETCASTGLDWKQRHCYLIKRGGKWSVTLSIDGFRLIAASDSDFNGQSGPFWTLGPDQPWSDIPPEKKPYAAKVGVYRKGQAEPTWGVAKFDDYNARSPMWTKFASTMIAKCAEMLALRKALPGKLGGLYGIEEMEQADVKKKPNSVDSSASAVIEEMSRAATVSDSSPSAEVGTPLTTEGYVSAIDGAATREALLDVGKAISSSGLGLQAKMELSKRYNSKKEREGWV